MLEPLGHHALAYASVPMDPLKLLDPAQRARGLPGLEQALLKARLQSDHEAVCRYAVAIADHHLERGRVAEARTHLLEAQVMAMAHPVGAIQNDVELRDAWLGHLLSEPGANERLEELLASVTDGPPLQFATAALYVAVARAGNGVPDDVLPLVAAAQSSLRKADGEYLPRLSLLAARAYQALGETDLAAVEALRVRVQADSQQNEGLATAASRILEGLGTGTGTDPRVHHLVSVAIEVARQRRLKDVLRSVVTSTVELLDADRAFVIRKQADGPQVVAAHAPRGDPGEPSSSIVRQAVELGREVVSADVGVDAELGHAASVMSLGLRTALCVPMMDGPQVIGAIYADSASATGQALGEAAWLVRAFAAHAVAAVRNAEHLQQTERRMRRAREMNHDVRNLVSSLTMGLSELHDDSALEPWAQALVGQMVDVAKLIRNQVQGSLSDEAPASEPLDLGAIAARVAEFMRFDANERSVTLNVQTSESHVIGTEGGLTRIVSNLLGNALKYAPPSSTVWVCVESQGGEATLSVRDEGQGLPKGSEEAIFRTGVQAEGHREGHGLGLGICRRLVRESGGSILARNHPDGGAEFVVSLPATDKPSA